MGELDPISVIEAAYRLRRQLRGQTSQEEFDADDADAILSADGKLTHVADRALAQESSSLEQLELAAEAIGRARGDMRCSAPVEAVDLWTGLAAGRYSLADRRTSISPASIGGVTPPWSTWAS